MSQTVRWQETLRRLAMIDEGFVEDLAGLGLGLARDAGAASQDRGTPATGRVGGHRGATGLRSVEHRPGAGRGRDR